MKIKMPQKLQRTIAQCGMKIAKASPELLLVAGAVGTVATVVLACKATLKSQEVFEEHKEVVDRIHQCHEDEEMKELYSQTDYRRDLTKAYGKTAVKLVKNYGPAVVVGVVSVGCFCESHNILKKRNIALAAAYKTVDTAFKEYRNRVKEELGNDVDDHFRYGTVEKEFKETVVNSKGKEKEVTTKEKIHQYGFQPNTAYDNGYGFYFISPYCKEATGNPEYDRSRLIALQNYFNTILKIEGHIFLNDIYKAVGLEPTKAGQVVGWWYDEECPVGDNYIDFRIEEVSIPTDNPEWRNGYMRCFHIDPNVDGNIWEMM